ncbi:N-acetyltransferase [Cognatishimia sp. MH4019]|uniref:GNAT family N-acetyltransferase n=1 Tax=Cognatishimia sp. MH4019 TaxID=2854030 RepID=UPI001CD609F3|nr:N-acetyltransferase [Cognatishimia sp. MH4019]
MTALHLAGPDDAARILLLMAQFHAHHGLDYSDDHRAAALDPLLNGSPLGVAYLIGPQKAPIGYVILSFGWSIAMGGMDGFIDEIYIRESVRGRGIGSEVLIELPKALAGVGLKALHLEVQKDNTRAQDLYRRLGFEPRDGYHLMTRTL